MILLDVNILVHAFHEASPAHAAYRAWLAATVEADEPFGLSVLVLSGFVRIATHRRVFDPPAPMAEAARVRGRAPVAAQRGRRGTGHAALGGL